MTIKPEKRRAIEAVLFDLDGTLVHSEEVAARTVEAIFRKHGIFLDARLAQLVTGKTWDAALNDLEAWVKFPVSREVIQSEIIQEYRIRLKTEVHPVPGGVEAVRSLSREFRLALVSGSYREEILFALRKLQIEEHFEVVLGAEDYLQSKPAPDGYLLALKQMNILPAQALVFEDSAPGIQSALCAGCKVVHVRHCQSVALDSPWVRQAHEGVDDLQGIHPQWVLEKFSSSSKNG